jgi:ubiquinone/menaquinone biosynthesis C-methylase UbiE
MDPQAPEAAEFREGQRNQWNTAATGWEKWSDIMDSGAAHISERMIELAGVQPGSRVLDVACGRGEPSLTAARAAAPDGSVTATDISAEMLAFGRDRAAAQGVENIEFVESGANALDFPAGTFDAAVSRWGIIFEPDGEGAAARVRGFLKPGSRFAISSWGTPDKVPFLGIPVSTTMQRLGIDPPPPGTPGPLSRPTPEAIGGLLEGGGFSDVQVEEIKATFTWDSAEDFTVFIREIAPPISGMINRQPPEVQAESWAAITEAIRERASEDGTLTMSNLVLLAVGSA